MDDFLLDDEGKPGHGFMSADELEQFDIGNGDRPRPMFISTMNSRIALLGSIMKCQD
jgi:hypothetical protein